MPVPCRTQKEDNKMATATPNILISSIRGRIGNVVFYKRQGTQCVRLHVIPRNPNTEAQRAVRLSFGNAVRSWQAMSADERYAYNRKARYLNMSGYNLYISNYIKRVMRILTLSPADEMNSKAPFFPWNLKLATWNYLPTSSVSESYMLPYRVRKPFPQPESSPG